MNEVEKILLSAILGCYGLVLAVHWNISNHLQHRLDRFENKLDTAYAAVNKALEGFAALRAQFGEHLRGHRDNE